MRFPLALTIAACAAALGGCASSGAVPRPFPGAALPQAPPTAVGTARAPVEPSPTAAPSFQEAPATAIVSTALELQGIPYRNGGTDPDGFDCSGFVQWVFGQLGVRLPREVRDQALVGNLIDAGHIEPGDLVFFETVSRGASHVGVAVGGGQFVHAPSSRGVVRVERYGAEYWAKRFVMARRVNPPAPTSD